MARSFTEREKENIKKMADLIAHRGPDSDGYYYDDQIALAFRRLSIIDLEGGSQPIYNEDKTKVIVFNGEIYNYSLLKKQLIKKGHVFTTNTDTEVLLHGYEQWQEKRRSQKRSSCRKHWKCLFVTDILLLILRHYQKKLAALHSHLYGILKTWRAFVRI